MNYMNLPMNYALPIKSTLLLAQILGNHHKSTTFPGEFPMFHAEQLTPALATKKCSESIPGTVPTSAGTPLQGGAPPVINGLL